jgi:hypothetical protein
MLTYNYIYIFFHLSPALKVFWGFYYYNSIVNCNSVVIVFYLG